MVLSCATASPPRATPFVEGSKAPMALHLYVTPKDPLQRNSNTHSIVWRKITLLPPPAGTHCICQLTKIKEGNLKEACHPPPQKNNSKLKLVREALRNIEADVS